MELTCPHFIWKIFPFNSTNRSVTKSFEFLNCDWRWEYSVNTELINEASEEIVTIYLKRLTNSSACSLQRVSTVVSLKGSKENADDVRVMDVSSPLVSWCVWQKPKSYILDQKAVKKNICSFSMTLEPSSPLEDQDSFSNGESFDARFLQELSKDFDKFLEVSRYTNVTLKCNNIEIKAHKDVLCCRSKKFTDMIENCEGTSMENTERIITLPCMDPDLFKILLRFLYTSTLPDLTNELARKIYAVADEYGIDSLKKKCAKFIIEHLCDSNAFETLIFANEHSDDYLKWAVSSKIACDLSNMLHRDCDEWKNFINKHEKLAFEVFRIFEERAYSEGYSGTPFSFDCFSEPMSIEDDI